MQQFTTARVMVMYDVLGVEDPATPPLVRTAREVAARALSTAGSEMVSLLINHYGRPAELFRGDLVRTSCGAYTHNLPPKVPVQIEVVFVVSSDEQGILWPHAETFRMELARLVLNWFQDQPGDLSRAAHINAIRISLMGLGTELICEVDPRSRIIIDAEGGYVEGVQRGVPIPYSY